MNELEQALEALAEASHQLDKARERVQALLKAEPASLGPVWEVSYTATCSYWLHLRAATAEAAEERALQELGEEAFTFEQESADQNETLLVS